MENRFEQQGISGSIADLEQTFVQFDPSEPDH